MSEIVSATATPIKLKAKYSKIAPRGLKNMKSPGGNSGGKKKNQGNKKSSNKVVPKKMVLFVNGKSGAFRMYELGQEPKING